MQNLTTWLSELHPQRPHLNAVVQHKLSVPLDAYYASGFVV